MSKKTKDALVVGFALFAVFFGAGNLIFPPLVGVVSGSGWSAAIMGLMLSGILLPIATIVAVDNMGGRFEQLCRPVSGWFCSAYMVFFVIFILTCGIPRQGGVGIETGLFSVFPILQGNRVAQLIGLLCYYVLVWIFTTRKSSFIDIIGKYLTPFLLVILLVIVAASVFAPIGTPVDTGHTGNFTYGFLQGYQTGDVAVGIVIAGTFIASIKSKGYEEKSARTKAVTKAAIVALIGLLIVYGGLLYLGATGSGMFASSMDQTALLVALVEKCIGRVGTAALGVGILLACLTTTIGVITTIAQLTETLTHGKLKLKTCILIYDVLGFLLATMGVAKVITYTYPVFVLIYPIAIVLTLLGCARKLVPNHGAWKGTVLMSSLIGIYEAVVTMNGSNITNIHIPALESLYAALPLSSYGFAWLLPCIIGFIVGAVIVKASGKGAYPMLEKSDEQ